MTKPTNKTKSRRKGPPHHSRMGPGAGNGRKTFTADPKNPSAPALPEVVLAEVWAIDPDGEALARPVEWDVEAHGKPPKIFLQPSTGHAALAVGERALMRLKRVSPRAYAGTVLKRIAAGKKARMVGLYQETPEGGRLIPTDRRQKDEVVILHAHRNGAEHGELVLAEFTGAAHAGLPQGTVLERLGFANAPKAISLIAIHTHEIPMEFPEAAIKEAEQAPRPVLGDRTDLRDIPLVTIDGADARDFDDAVYAERDGEGWKLLVAIADVAHYVKPDSPLDKSAYERGNSTYFPDRVVPMLPEALSNDLCSLRPHEDRACLACWLYVNKDGVLTRHQFVRGLMKSRARLIYEQVQRAYDGLTDETTAPLMDDVIKPLYGAYHTLLAARQNRGTLELDLPERKVIIDPKGRVQDISPRLRLDSHRLIEEFMILANVAAAEALEAKNMGTLYRVHEAPSLMKMEALRTFLKPLGYSVPQANVMQPRMFAKVLEESKDSPLSQMISMVVLRSQSQARYAPENQGHFGLALTRYAHFTSPIRRYADLVVHRGLIKAYNLGDGGISSEELSELEDMGEHISATERRSALAERDAVDRYTAIYLAERTGAYFEGRVTGVTRFGMFIELDETGADGLVPMNSLDDDFYTHDETHHCLIGRRNGRVLRLGARCKVKLLAADALQGSTVFELASIEEFEGNWPPANQTTKKFIKPKKHKAYKDKEARAPKAASPARKAAPSAEAETPASGPRPHRKGPRHQDKPHGGKSYGESSSAENPRHEKPHREKPYSGRPDTDKASGEKRWGEKKASGDKAPYGTKPYAGKSHAGKPAKGKSFAGKPRTGGGKRTAPKA